MPLQRWLCPAAASNRRVTTLGCWRMATPAAAGAATTRGAGLHEATNASVSKVLTLVLHKKQLRKILESHRIVTLVCPDQSIKCVCHPCTVAPKLLTKGHRWHLP